MQTTTSIVKFCPQRNQVYAWDALQLLEHMDDESVDCIVTSPPYFGLRDYGFDKQIGLEPTVEEYLTRLSSVFREAKRVLKNTGTMWINIGDSYANDDKWGGSTGGKHITRLHGNTGVGRKRRTTGLPPKSRMMIPAHIAISLQNMGWILRQENIWEKPNVMPENVSDRTTTSHEIVYHFVKKPRYKYNADAIAEKSLGLPAPTWDERKAAGEGSRRGFSQNAPTGAKRVGGGDTRNARSVWSIPTEPTPFAHFATMPTELVRKCILAGCPVDGLVFDPFMGSGTVGLVARQLGRDYIGAELNPEYAELARWRIAGRIDDYMAMKRGDLINTPLFDIA